MQEFSVGDKVKVSAKNMPQFDREGTVSKVELAGTTWPVLVRFQHGDESYYGVNELEKIQPKQEPIVVSNAEAVEHPAHYGGDTVYEVIKVCEAWGLDKDAYLFNVVKYVGRAGKKSKATLLQDLKKARFYLDRRIKELEG